MFSTRVLKETNTLKDDVTVNPPTTTFVATKSYSSQPPRGQSNNRSHGRGHGRGRGNFNQSTYHYYNFAFLQHQKSVVNIEKCVAISKRDVKN